MFACRGPLSEPIVSVELNVFVPVNVLFVYVFGIVVDEWLYELVVLFSNVVSSVRMLDVFSRPEPRSEIKV